MENVESIQVCKSCGFSGNGNYCSRCGLPHKTKRISMAVLLHDVFHFFTHLDKGFGYTMKRLIIAPGHMQREYIEGDRVRHQKPFSMFFICATVAALGRYWIHQFVMTHYHTGNVSEGNFLHEYMVLFHIVLLPLYALLTYLLFHKSGYNYAEVGVLVLYSVSVFFIFTLCVSLLKFIWAELDTAYIELPILLIYNTITFVNFFHKEPSWIVTLKSIFVVAGLFLLIQVLEDYIIARIS